MNYDIIKPLKRRKPVCYIDTEITLGTKSGVIMVSRLF